jgi:hypothetical protein
MGMPIMMRNNWQGLNIWIKLGRVFDYTAFKSSCEAEGILPLSALEFAQKAGIIECSITEYPDLPAQEAYLKFIQEHQQSIVLEPRSFGIVAKQSSCCGGGEVR